MSNVIGRSFVKEGEASLNLTSSDLFDKIINLKFIRKSTRSFNVRSDYEPVFHKDNTISFKRCVQKPDIKVTYKQVANSVAIEVDIRIANFFVGDGDKESTESMNTVTGDPVQWCIIQMGYRAQFPDWTKAKDKDDIKKFYDLDNGPEIRKHNQILVQILTGYSESYPPDKVTYFKGIVGSMETGLRWHHSKNDLVRGYGDPAFPKKLSEIEAVLFQFVTRRFIRPSIKHTAETKNKFTDKKAIEAIENKEFEQKILIDEKGTDDWMELPVLDNGIMSIENANRFGVVCAVSKTLRDLPENVLHGFGFAGLTPEQVQEMGSIKPSPFNVMHNTIGGQLVAIQKHYPFLRWYKLMENDNESEGFYFYHENDTDEDLWSDPFVKMIQKDNTVFLPAIYDMTPCGTRTIRCLFTSYISPMMTVRFQTRHTIGTLVSYFYPVKTDRFLVIIANVSFATVQEDNLMELMCVDLPPEDINKAIEKKEEEAQKTEESTVQKQKERNMAWTEELLTVVLHRSGATDTESRWVNIVSNDVRKRIRLDRWPEGTKVEDISEQTMLEALKKWNPDYFDPNGKHMALGNSIENSPSGIGGRTGIKVPWLKVGDKIAIRTPFQPEYPDDKKVEAV